MTLICPVVGRRVRKFWYLTALSAALFLWVAFCDGRSAHAGAAVATAVEMEHQGQNTVLRVHLNKPAEFKVITLPDPYRVVIDLTHVEFDLAANSGGVGVGVVKAYRYGRYADNKARIVLDTDGPAQVIEAKAAHTDNGAVVRITLATTTERVFGKVYRRRKRREAIVRQDAAGWEAIAKPVNVDKQGKKVVVIDPGHGGVDSGALAPGNTKEKHIVLAFSKELRRALAATGKYIVHMSRDKDVFVPLKKRVDFARRRQADLFISVHADSVASKQYAGISGTTIYTLSDEGSDAAAREFAERENRSDVLAGVEVPDQSDELASILIELAQRETNARSERFARAALSQIRRATKLSRGPHRSAGFAVLKAPDIPSVLIELGYLSNTLDAQQLKSPVWRRSVARSLTRSINRYFARQDKALPF